MCLKEGGGKVKGGKSIRWGGESPLEGEVRTGRKKTDRGTRIRLGREIPRMRTKGGKKERDKIISDLETDVLIHQQARGGGKESMCYMGRGWGRGF